MDLSDLICYLVQLFIMFVHFPVDLMSMGGYSAPPVMLAGSGAGGKPERSAKTRGYSQYPTTFAYPGGWGDHHMAGGFYGPAGYGVHMPMMRGHMGMDPAVMDYMTEQFQGKTCLFVCDMI